MREAAGEASTVPRPYYDYGIVDFKTWRSMNAAALIVNAARQEPFVEIVDREQLTTSEGEVKRRIAIQGNWASKDVASLSPFWRTVEMVEVIERRLVSTPSVDQQ